MDDVQISFVKFHFVIKVKLVKVCAVFLIPVLDFLNLKKLQCKEL